MKNGLWLFREHSGIWWRLTRVSNGKAFGKWIATHLDVDKIKGEWKKPTAQEIELCQQDSMCRLIK